MIVFKIWFSILAFALGSSLGSFVGLLAQRVPKGMSIIKPNSHCNKCKKSIKLYDNIPVLSWIILGGKCRYCKAPIGTFSLLLEIAGGLGYMLTYLQYGNRFENLPIFLALIVLIFLFLIIAAIDYETHDIYNITLIIFALISVFIFAYRITVLDSNAWSYIGGAIFGFIFFCSVKLISQTILKQDALGAGDVYLVGIAGLILGIFPLLISIIIATLLGSIIELVKIKTAKTSGESEIAFGPYLLFGIAIMAIYGEVFMNFYWEVMLNVIA